MAAEEDRLSPKAEDELALWANLAEEPEALKSKREEVQLDLFDQVKA